MTLFPFFCWKRMAQINMDWKLGQFFQFLKLCLQKLPKLLSLVEGDIVGYPIPQYRKKKWQIPKYRVENHLNTDTAYFNHIYNRFRIRLRAVSLFSVVCRAKRETRKWPRAWLMALVSRVLPLARLVRVFISESSLARQSRRGQLSRLSHTPRRQEANLIYFLV